MEIYTDSKEREIEKDKYIGLLELIKKSEEITESRHLSTEQIISESRAIIAEMLVHLREDLHLELSDNVTEIYEEMSEEDVLARVENIGSVIKCLTSDTPIIVGSVDKHYANSVTPDKEGLRIAMAEADAIGPMRLMVGLDVKTLVGFRNDHLEVSEIDDNEFDIRDTSMRKAFCRHIQGEIHSDDIRYLVMRIPRAMFPQDELLSSEAISQAKFIFRGAKVHTGVGNEETFKRAA